MSDDSEQERWSDEEHENLTREEVIARFCQLQGKVAHEAIDGYDLPNDCFCEQPDKGGIKPGHADRGHFRSSGQALRWIEEAVERRLRGGEVERDEVEKRFDRIHAHDATGRNRLARALDVSPEQDVADVWREIERKVDSLLSPTDGESGLLDRIPADPSDLDAAPDTEGREAALVKASEFHEGPYTHLAHRGDGEAVCGVEVVAWGDEPDPDAAEPICAECLRQIPRPEEAGGEDVLEGMEPEPVTNLHQRIKVAVDKRGPYDGAVTLTVPEAVWVADRLRGAPEGVGREVVDAHGAREAVAAMLVDLPEDPDDKEAVREAWAKARRQARDVLDAHTGLRGAPEGAGDTTPVKLHHSDVAAYILEGPDGPVSRDEALRSLHKLRELALPARLRTGREGRDDG